MEILPRAKRQLLESALWWAEKHSTAQAARWLDGIEAAILDLAHDPERFHLAFEAEELQLPLRQRNFGISRHPTHRILFVVEPERVVVYTVRHIAQRDLPAEEVDQQ